jgi:hypothetical protein
LEQIEKRPEEVRTPGLKMMARLLCISNNKEPRAQQSTRPSYQPGSIAFVHSENCFVKLFAAKLASRLFLSKNI